MINSRLTVKTDSRISIRKVKASSREDLHLMIGVMERIEGCKVVGIVIV